jgi:hypothetical protein
MPLDRGQMIKRFSNGRKFQTLSSNATQLTAVAGINFIGSRPFIIAVQGFYPEQE